MHSNDSYADNGCNIIDDIDIFDSNTLIGRLQQYISDLYICYKVITATEVFDISEKLIFNNNNM